MKFSDTQVIWLIVRPEWIHSLRNDAIEDQLGLPDLAGFLVMAFYGVEGLDFTEQAAHRKAVLTERGLPDRVAELLEPFFKEDASTLLQLPTVGEKMSDAVEAYLGSLEGGE